MSDAQQQSCMDVQTTAQSCAQDHDFETAGYCCFVKSTLTAAGASARTVIVARRSP